MRRPRFLQIILLLALSWSVQASGRVKLNVFDKPNEQSEARFDSAMARKGRVKLNFNADWRLCVGDFPKAAEAAFDDSRWQQVTLPYAFNGHEAFMKDIVDLTDTICWYRKTFSIPASFGGDGSDSKVFIEFEGVRQGADF